MISRPEARIAKAEASLANVLIYDPTSNVWPTSSGQTYVSPAAICLSFITRLEGPAVPLEATKLQLNVATAADVLHTVNLSIVVGALAVY
ncbi:TPA: hypothetical protein ACJKLK_001192 [Acinetobacter baumannii]